MWIGMTAHYRAAFGTVADCPETPGSRPNVPAAVCPSGPIWTAVVGGAVATRGPASEAGNVGPVLPPPRVIERLFAGSDDWATAAALYNATAVTISMMRSMG